MTIKPEDIPHDFVEVAEELYVQGYWSHNTKHNVAAFLNAAIGRCRESAVHGC